MQDMSFKIQLSLQYYHDSKYHKFGRMLQTSGVYDCTKYHHSQFPTVCMHCEVEGCLATKVKCCIVALSHSGHQVVCVNTTSDLR